ncbi:MAG: tetratricopeptide repeat protein [Dysgonomonas sp.]
MVKKIILLVCLTITSCISISAQINTDRVMIIGRNALYYEDYVLSIQYFNQVIKAKPYLAEPYFYRAIAKFYLDDSKGAEDDCSLAIERNPFFVNAYQLRGDARLNLNDFDGAISDYKKTLEYSPDNKYALINIGVSNIQKKNYTEAEKELDELMKFYPKYTQGYLVRGSMYQETGDTVKALENFDQAINTDKYYAQAYSMRGLFFYQQKQYSKSLQDLDEAIKLDPTITGNYINRGLVRYSLNDLRGAMEDYDRVIEKEPYNIIARFNRGLLRSQVGDDNRAIEDFNIVIQYEPENYFAYLNRSLLKGNISDYKGALSDLNTVLKEYPDFYQGYYMRSEIKRKTNDMRGAEKDYLYARNQEEKAKQLALKNDNEEEKDTKTREQSDNTINKFNLLVVADAEEQQKSKYKNEARGRVQDRQVKIEPESRFVATYYEKSDELKNFVRYNPEIEALNKKNVLNQKLIITNKEVPLTQSQINTHFASIDEYSKLIAENQNNADLYFARGLDYMLVQNIPSAIEDFSEATKTDSKFTLAYFNLAVMYTKQLEMKNYTPEYTDISSGSNILTETAKKDDSLLGIPAGSSSTNDLDANKRLTEYYLILENYSKVIELDPDFVYAYYNRGEIRAMQRDYRAAVLDYNEAIRREPEFAEAYFNRGLNRLQLGEKEKGLDDLRKAGELGIINAYNIIKRMTE